MSKVPVFVGLVSHMKTSFPDSQGPDGLATKLASGLAALGAHSALHINTRDFFTEMSYSLTPGMARASVREEIRLESLWSKYLGRPDMIREAKRHFGRFARYLTSRKANSQTFELQRLLNIEYSHVDLYRRAVDSGAEWAVILEDDAATTDVANLAEGLMDLFTAETKTKMINLSASFPLALIGVQQMLTVDDQIRWNGTDARVIYQSERPATNTVCAVAFRTVFLAQLLADFESQPAEPVVPIDWKINASLMRLWNAKLIGPNECWFVEPAPIIQLSMVRDREG